jgi:uncharacterized membrane protein YdbT with pleckstrin-like domain|tara:strand:+ start:763 stop:1173 length:411 start_codon:yes stop_codon:yes gene_type:complete
MAEEKTIWKGSPSQWINFTSFLSSILVVTIPFVIWKWLTTKFTIIEVTNERIITETGVLSKTTDEVELFRVKDIRLDQPIFLRLVGLSNVLLITTDRTHGVVKIEGVTNGKELRESLRSAVDVRRDKKRVREVDFE